MVQVILESLLQLLLLVPLILISLENRTKENYYRIFFFISAFIGYTICLRLPYYYESFNFITTNWNWDGKIYGVIFGITSYFIFKKYFSENDFFTLKQNKKNLPKSVYAAIGVVFLSTIFWFILGKSDFNLEALLFQLTMPGIDEEIMYRGVLLGLLSSSLKDRLGNIGNPSVLITAILFGLIHSLILTKEFTVNFNFFAFIQTAFAGYIWGWITIKSRSILLALASHNLSNFFGTLVTMIK